jgi:hypothetical protein
VHTKISLPIYPSHRPLQLAHKEGGGLTEPLHDALSVVVRPSTGLAPLLEPDEHDLFGAGEEDDGCGGADGCVKLEGLVHLPGEAVDEKSGGGALCSG